MSKEIDQYLKKQLVETPKYLKKFLKENKEYSPGMTYYTGNWGGGHPALTAAKGVRQNRTPSPNTTNRERKK